MREQMQIDAELLAREAQLDTPEGAALRELGNNLDNAVAAMNEMPVKVPQKEGHQRAGITTNHGHGQSKARRKMAKASRRRNRV